MVRGSVVMFMPRAPSLRFGVLGYGLPPRCVVSPPRAKSRNTTCSVATYCGRVAWLPMRAETLKGHLDGILLAVLEPGPRHGYAIMEALRIRSGGHVHLPTGTAYPAVHRLEPAALSQARWSAPGGRRR